MSIAAMMWAYEQSPRGSAGKKFVLVTLGDHADENDECYPGQELLAQRTNQGVSTVRQQLKELEEEGYITRVKRYKANGTRNSDRYRLHRQKPAVSLPTTAEIQQALPLNPGGEPSERENPQITPPYPPKGGKANNGTSPGTRIAEFIDEELILQTGAGLGNHRARTVRQFNALVAEHPVKHEIDAAIWKFIERYPAFGGMSADRAWQEAKRESRGY